MAKAKEAAPVEKKWVHPETRPMVTIQKGDRIRQCADVDVKFYEGQGYKQVKA